MITSACYYLFFSANVYLTNLFSELLLLLLSRLLNLAGLRAYLSAQIDRFEIA
jgi:hypothetical protein